MERVAAFVFASGGAVHPQELQDFFKQEPDVHAAVLADGFPSTSLKKIVVKVGRQHGLFWCDDDPHNSARGPTVVHEITAAQRERGAFDNEVQWIPRSLSALEQHVRALPRQKMSPGEIAQFYNACPLESAFMKRRCGGVAAFVVQYGAGEHGMSVDERGHVCARTQETDAPAATATRVQAGARVERKDAERALGNEAAAEPEDEADLWRSQPSTSPRGSLLMRKVSLDPPAPSASSDHVGLGAATLAVDGATDVKEANGASFALLALSKSNKPALAKTSVSLASPLELQALERVSQLLSHVRAPPRLHPLAFSIVVFERQQQTKRARKLARQATRQAPGPEQADPENALVACERTDERRSITFRKGEREATDEATLVSAAPVMLLPQSNVAVNSVVPGRSASLVKRLKPRHMSAWTFVLGNSASALNVTVASVLARVTEVLLTIRAIPAMHPLAVEITLAVRVRQQQKQRRAMAKRSRSQMAAPLFELLTSGLCIVIPRATLEVLSAAAL